MTLSPAIVAKRLTAKIFLKLMKAVERELKNELKNKPAKSRCPTALNMCTSVMEPRVSQVAIPQQSQLHGFVFENQIRTSVFGMTSSANDTGKHDIPKGMNSINPNENVSIKTTGRNSICCGDILRFYDYDFTDENTMIVGQYKQAVSQKIITRIVELDYNAELHRYLFGTVTREELVSYVDMVKAVPRGKVSARLRQEILNKKKDIERNHGMAIQISPKIDSGSQRRVQCMIRNVDDLIRDVPSSLKSLTTDGIIRGASINLVIPSAVRTRHTRHSISSDHIVT